MIFESQRRHLPTFAQLCADLGQPTAAQLGAFLGVHARTVERWRRHDQAPRAVLLALYWVSSWGRSELACDLENRAAAYAGHVAALERERDALRRELARVLAAGDFGAANRPTFHTWAPITRRQRQLG